MLKCSKCKEWKDESGFSLRKDTATGFNYICKTCDSANSLKFYERRKDHRLCVRCGRKSDRPNGSVCSLCVEKIRLESRAYKKKLKLELLNAYGGAVCACCGERQIEFLSIDHIDGGGNKHRREQGIRGGNEFYLWLKKNNYPHGYRVLCFNCNLSKGFYGYCPHEWDKLYPMIYAEQDIDLTQWKEAMGL